jgi:hypothetical protein
MRGLVVECPRSRPTDQKLLARARTHARGDHFFLPSSPPPPGRGVRVWGLFAGAPFGGSWPVLRSAACSSCFWVRSQSGRTVTRRRSGPSDKQLQDCGESEISEGKEHRPILPGPTTDRGETEPSGRLLRGRARPGWYSRSRESTKNPRVRTEPKF